MFRSYSALIVKYMFFALPYYFNLKSKWKTNVMNKANFTDSKKLKIQTSILRSKNVIKKNVKKLRHHVVKMLQISITRNSAICKLKVFCFYYVIDTNLQPQRIWAKSEVMIFTFFF